MERNGHRDLEVLTPIGQDRSVTRRGSARRLGRTQETPRDFEPPGADLIELRAGGVPPETLQALRRTGPPAAGRRGVA